MENQDTIKLKGIVENVIFSNENTGYIVLEVTTDTDIITVVGELGELYEGEEIIFLGNYANHPKFGVQFHAEYCERTLPSTKINIQKYLSSGVIKGIGASLSQRLVKEFGEDTLEVIRNHPEKLVLIKGITPQKANEISKEMNKVFNIHTLLTYFSQFSIRPYFAMKAFQKWSFDSIKVVKDNPYLLCDETIGLGFEKAEAMANDIGIEYNSPKRVTAGIFHILIENTYRGNTCIALENLIHFSCQYLKISKEDFEIAYQMQKDDDNIREFEKDNTVFTMTSEYAIAENDIVTHFKMLADFQPQSSKNYSKLIDDIEFINNINYADLQREAIQYALSRGCLILTGGPGTGKTTTLNAIISIYEAQGKRVMVSAPTGRAAQRISDLTGYDAKTIHRMLGVEHTKDGQLCFTHDAKNPLQCDVMVVDEMSMVDTLLFAGLLRALKSTCRIIMVGDSDQLPSVGAGNVLNDLIKSECLAVIELKEIFRQAQKSCIITNAHKIVNGEYPEISLKDNDFFFFQRLTADTVTAMLLDLASNRLPSTYGYTADDIQILSPTRKGALGTVELNKQLQEKLNPLTEEKQEVKSIIYTFRTGDKIMQNRNNYDIIWSKNGEAGAGIFNGDIGKITKIDKRNQEVTVDFEGRKAIYNFELLEQIELAYAITIHKSQGSEFEATIIPLLGGFDQLYYRNLLYTAVTRAKKLLIIVGSQNILYRMVDNNRQTMRYTCLRERIENEFRN